MALGFSLRLGLGLGLQLKDSKGTLASRGSAGQSVAAAVTGETVAKHVVWP